MGQDGLLKFGDILVGMVFGLQQLPKSGGKKTMLHIEIILDGKKLRTTAVVSYNINDALKYFKNKEIRLTFRGLAAGNNVNWEVELV